MRAAIHLKANKDPLKVALSSSALNHFGAINDLQILSFTNMKNCQIQLNHSTKPDSINLLSLKRHYDSACDIAF